MARAERHDPGACLGGQLPHSIAVILRAATNNNQRAVSPCNQRRSSSNIIIIQ